MSPCLDVLDVWLGRWAGGQVGRWAVVTTLAMLVNICLNTNFIMMYAINTTNQLRDQHNQPAAQPTQPTNCATNTTSTMVKQSVTFTGPLGVKNAFVNGHWAPDSPIVRIVVNNVDNDVAAARILAQKVFDERAHANCTELSVENVEPDPCGVNTITMHLADEMIAIFTWQGQQVKNMYYPRYRYMPDYSKCPTTTDPTTGTDGTTAV